MANQGANKGTYLNLAELKRVEYAAAAAGLTVSAWIKRAIMMALTTNGGAK